MIKLFRQIRKNLLSEKPSKRTDLGSSQSKSEQRSTKYLKYAIGEIILVVIGILVALQINNWNEEQKLDKKAQDYYLQLLDDLNSDIVFSNNTIKDYKNQLDQYEVYTQSYIKDTLSPKDAYEHIFSLPIITQPLTFNTSTLETLQSSGDIGLISSDIRNRLIDLKRLQNLTITRFENTDIGKNNITQNLSLLLGSTTLPKRLENQPEIKELLNIEANLKQLILVFEGIHRWKSVSQQEAIDRLQHMSKEIDTIVGLINNELE